MNPQIPGQNSLISFPLDKFSWASDSPSTKSSSWNHAEQNIVIVFDSFRSGGFHPSCLPTLLKVVQGTKTLEFVDIGEKVRMSKIVVDSARRVGIKLRTADLPCAALHRRTACTIAIRYNLPNGFVRVETFMHVIFFTLTWANVKVRRIQLNLTSYPDFDEVLAILENSGLTSIDCTPSATVRGSRAAGVATKGSANGQSAVPAGQAIATNSGLKGLSSPTGNSVAASEDFRSIPRTHMQSDNPSSETLHPEHPLDRPVTSGPSWHAGLVQQQRPSTALPRINEHEDAPDPAPTGPSDLTYPHLDHPRPSTALSPQIEIDLSTTIPPRRELPFKRNSKTFRASSQEGSSSKTSTSIIDLPPLPEPYFTKNNTSSSTQRRWTQTAQASPVFRRDYLGKGDKSAVTSKPKACRKVAGSTAEALEDWSTNVQIDKLDQVRPNTNHDTQTEPAQFSVPHPISTKPPSAAPNPPSDESFSAPLNDILERLGPYLDSTSNEREPLTSYAALPNEERMKVLEGEIVRLLGDESFVQLCEDLGACWQRIGLKI